MKSDNIQEQINEINNKLDLILQEIELQSKHRREMEDLKEDLMRVGKDLYDSTVLELEEVHDQLQTGDILYLFKKLLRNVNNLTKTFEQLENTKDFLQDFAPISRELFLDFLGTLDEFDRKGYFAFMKELMKVMDRIVVSFNAEDVRNLGDNIVTILNTIKNLTQPELLSTVNNAVAIYKNLEGGISEKVSYMTLLKELNKPEIKRGLAFALKFLQNLGEQDNKNKSLSINQIQSN